MRKRKGRPIPSVETITSGDRLKLLPEPVVIKAVREEDLRTEEDSPESLPQYINPVGAEGLLYGLALARHLSVFQRAPDEAVITVPADFATQLVSSFPRLSSETLSGFGDPLGTWLVDSSEKEPRTLSARELLHHLVGQPSPVALQVARDWLQTVINQNPVNYVRRMVVDILNHFKAYGFTEDSLILGEPRVANPQLILALMGSIANRQPLYGLTDEYWETLSEAMSLPREAPDFIGEQNLAFTARDFGPRGRHGQTALYSCSGTDWQRKVTAERLHRLYTQKRPNSQEICFVLNFADAGYYHSPTGIPYGFLYYVAQNIPFGSIAPDPSAIEPLYQGLLIRMLQAEAEFLEQVVHSSA